MNVIFYYDDADEADEETQSNATDTLIKRCGGNYRTLEAPGF